MSNAKKCDRCGKYYDPYDDCQHLMRPHATHVHDFVDLCPNCNDDLVRWMNNYQLIVEPVDE